ncbi:hypothetical protein OO258_26065 [Pseudomonas sp. DCB_BI]|uniref:hypothetical protein n=1 Tax=Pseudomonas sp. DCB_BI TaxID=2993594 RepID=UPI00224A75E9|nr:hypothetical protein [Pseudomonas sp. DCB_BI]MCX2891697.1 hypothetical protein [Pseudomonas sp. DCB_BI]
MPTENRSSNTEMVSVPFHREDRYIVVKRSDLAKVPVAYRSALVDPLFHLQAHLPQRECLVIESDWPEYEPTWAAIQAHVTGQPAPQPQAEPIAWMVGTAFWWTKEEAERDAAATGLPIVGLGPMTDRGEAEQLREVIKYSDDQIMRQSLRISNQRAQLAERDALLRDNSGKLIRMAAHLISAPLFALQDLQDEDKKMSRARVDKAVDTADARLKDAAYELRRIADALSASAGPSSPTWSCQACQVEQPTDRACDACGGKTELAGAKS